MKNAADIEPSRETSLLNSNAMRGNMADRLNQFIPYTILAIIKENDALASELNIILFFLFERLYTILFLHLYSHILYSPPIFSCCSTTKSLKVDNSNLHSAATDFRFLLYFLLLSIKGLLSSIVFVLGRKMNGLDKSDNRFFAAAAIIHRKAFWFSKLAYI